MQVEQEWGPKEVLAHLVYHQEGYAAQIQALLMNEPFHPPQGRFRDLNALAVAANRGIPIEELVSRFHLATKKLKSLYQNCDPTKVFLEIKKGSKCWRLFELVPAVESHIRNHQKQIIGRFKKEKKE